MQLIKGLIISVVVLLLFASFAITVILVKNNVVATNYSGYWQEQIIDKANYTIAVMGDSTAIGVGASSPQKSFVGILREKIKAKKNKSVRIVNLSHSDASFEDVLVKQLPKLSQEEANLVIVSAGRANVDSKTLNINTLNRLMEMLPSGITYFTEIPAGYDPKKNRIAAQFNEILKETGEGHAVDVIPLYDTTLKYQFDFSYYDWDFIHPNDKGHGIWADLIYSSIY